MEQYDGILIGFCNQGRKRVLKGFNENLKRNSNIKIEKFKGFSGDNKQQIQQELKALVKQHNQVNTIYIVLKYERIDNMRKKLQLMIDHFQHYLSNVCLIISNFQLSQNRELDQILIFAKLKDYFKIPQCIQYYFGTTIAYDNIYMENRCIKFEDLMQRTLKHNKKVTLTSKSMDLDIIINYEILDELNKIVYNQRLQDQQSMQQSKKIQQNYYQINEEIDNKKQVPQLFPTFFEGRNRTTSQNNHQYSYQPQPQKQKIFGTYFNKQVIQKKLFKENK